MDLDTLIQRLEDRASGNLKSQSDTDDCREALVWLRRLRAELSAMQKLALHQEQMHKDVGEY